MKQFLAVAAVSDPDEKEGEVLISFQSTFFISENKESAWDDGLTALVDAGLVSESQRMYNFCVFRAEKPKEEI